MRRKFQDHSFTITMVSLFLVFWGAQALIGSHTYNNEQTAHNETTIVFSTYLRSGHFIEATFENWESEFLQMGLYVLLKAFLIQRGSAESNDPDGSSSATKESPPGTHAENAPWSVRRSGLSLMIYNNSLSLALLMLFAVNFVLHLYGGAKVYNDDQLVHGG